MFVSTKRRGIWTRRFSQKVCKEAKNTLHKKLLSPVKRMAIERKVYAFMRVKDKTISQVDDFLNDLNVSHHKVIYAAGKRLEFIQKLKAVEEAEVGELSDGQSAEPKE